MTIRAYQEIYLSKAQALLGEAFDYAVNTCEIPGDDFVKLFLASQISKRMENGEPSCIAGKSGIEIVQDVVYETTQKEIQHEAEISYSRSTEYWCGWAVAYYQWYSGRKYYEIFRAVSFSDLQKMYYTLHEADITKVVDVIQRKINAQFPETNLKRIRAAYGCTQAELAKNAGVSLRSIQMDEQRNKDINKASVAAVYGIAKALGCTVEDIIEK